MKMERNNKMYHGESEEKFWDDIMGPSSDFPDTPKVSASGGVDILQQSLQQAHILDTNDSADPLDFDDFGFTFSNHSNNSSDFNKLFDPISPASGLATTTSDSQASHPQQDSPVPFDVSEFLNFTSSATQTVTTTTAQLAQVSTTSITNKPQLVSSANPVAHTPLIISQPVSRTQAQSSIPNQLPTSAASATAKAFVLHLAKGNQTSANSFVVTPQNSRYIVAGVQSMPTLTNVASPAQVPVTAQSHLTAVCSSAFTKTISPTVSSPLIISTAALNTRHVAAPAAQVNAVQAQPALNQIRVALPQKQTVFSHDEQANKLALALQSRAVHYPGLGKLLKVGNQNINISDFAVAKSLASRILQQKLNQQKPNQVPAVNPTQASNVNHNVTVINIPISGLKNAAVVSMPQHNQVLTSNQVASVKNTVQVATAAPTITLVNKAVIQVTKADSSPQNRFQIASVNISRPSIQPNLSSSVMQHRINSPIIIASAPQTNNKVPAFPSGASAPSTAVQYPSTTIKLNLTPQQASNLTTEQLQKLVLQHQAAVAAKKTAIPGATPTQPTNGATSGIKHIPPTQGVTLDKMRKVMTFRVDPNLNNQQIEEVQQIILQKVPLNKAQHQGLTAEQKQLLSAFRAQLRTVDHAMQQYYLKNPHLFLQKVFQHIRSGKPFLFQVQLDHLQSLKNSSNLASNLSSKPPVQDHPTISLSAEGHRHKRAPPFGSTNNAPVVSAPAQVVGIQSQFKLSASPIQSPSTYLRPPIPSRTPSPLRTSTSIVRPTTVLSTARKMKRSANITPDHSAMHALPAKRPSLVLEQLQKHRELAAGPEVEKPFKSVRDAYRRLLPFHVYNTPQIKRTSFDESDAMFHTISESVATKSNKMLKKYHLLCLKDAAIESCSSDSVMLDRIFLQQEKAALAETKQAIKDDPDNLMSNLHPSYAQQFPALASFAAHKKAKQEAEARAIAEASKTPATPPEVPSKPPDPDDLLLQEAVESILA